MSITIEPYGRLLWCIAASYYSPKLRYAGKHTPGLEWNHEEKCWWGYADAVDACAAQLRAMGLRVTGDVPTMIDPRQLQLTLPVATKDLFDYQAQGAEFLVAFAREGAILADQMGLGKSAQALRAARALRAKTLILCPSMVKQVWKDEAAKWWPEARIGELRGVKDASRRAFKAIAAESDIIICHYDIVHAWAEFIVGWPDLLNLDEAHYLISDRARRSRAVKLIAAATPWRFALTGTPMTSRPKDLWNLLDTISPGRFGKFFPFALRFCEAHQEEVESKRGGAATTKVFWKFDGSSNLPELKKRLGFMMLRRTKSEVAHQLPPMTRQILEVDVPKRAIIAPHLAFKSETALRRALTMAADGKLPQVTSLVLDHARGGSRRVIVWCWRRAIAEFIAQEIHRELPERSVAVVHGGHSHKERRRRIDEQPDVLCATMDSIGVGINLVAYDTEVFAELSWLPSTLAQCEARPHRHGQTRNVLVQYVIAKGTADEFIKAGIILKLDTSSKLGLDSEDRLKEDLETADEAARGQALHNLYLRIVAQQENAA